jgi:hypothetical protein
MLDCLKAIDIHRLKSLMAKLRHEQPAIPLNFGPAGQA